MKVYAKKYKVIILITAATALGIYVESCTKSDGLIAIDNAIQLHSRLSDNSIFQGKLSDLVPATGYELYELSSQLYTDYAEKQRLIKLPAGETLQPVDDGLPEFPDGTILVKTFYYYHDKRDTAAGKKIIETRLLIKSGNRWSVGTYLWNEAQNEATLIATGLNKTINWINEAGEPKVISYHIPKNGECNTCHQYSDKMIPIGPTMRNLNRNVTRNGTNKNQLQHLQEAGIFDAIDPSSYSSLPDWSNTSVNLAERARAYLDVNCAHCHNPGGFAAGTDLILSYHTPLENTRILKRKEAIIRRMARGQMPKLGTTIVHKEGLELIKSYINSLH